MYVGKIYSNIETKITMSYYIQQAKQTYLLQFFNLIGTVADGIHIPTCILDVNDKYYQKEIRHFNLYCSTSNLVCSNEK